MKLFNLCMLVFIIAYILGVLAGASFNPFAWSQETRTAIATFSGIFIAAGSMVNYLGNNHK